MCSVVSLLTLKALELPSMATEIGPAVATAALRSDSLPEVMVTMPASVAPMYDLL